MLKTVVLLNKKNIVLIYKPLNGNVCTEKFTYCAQHTVHPASHRNMSSMAFQTQPRVSAL